MHKESPTDSTSGLSVIELLIVLAVIAILSAMSLPYIYNYKKVYKSEDQSLKVLDLMREAGQLAITRRKTMRFEIDLTDNALLIIEEKPTTTDTLVKKIPLEPTSELRIDRIPSGVTKPNPPGYADATFAADSVGHLVGNVTVSGHTVWAGRFRRDGSMVNYAQIPISTNIYVWPPASPGSNWARNNAEARAITIFGGSGAVRYWKYSGSAFVPY